MTEIPRNVEGAYLREPDPIAALALDLLRIYVSNNAVSSSDACRHMDALGSSFTLETQEGADVPTTPSANP